MATMYGNIRAGSYRTKRKQRGFGKKARRTVRKGKKGEFRAFKKRQPRQKTYD